MKYLFYINTLSGGGAERVITNLANYFSKTNEVILVNSFRTNEEYPLLDSVIHIYLDDNNYKSRFKKNYKRVSLLRRILKREKPDYAISFMAEPNLRLIFANIGLKTKTIISVRNDPITEYPGFVGKFISKFILPKADGCVFQTKMAKEWFPEKLQKKSTIILNPVNHVFFDDYIDEEKKNIVTCGRLSKQKNHKLLIDAYELIKDSIDEKLVIYGKGEMEEELKKYVISKKMEAQVIFAGQTNDVVNAIRNSKVFVLSSNYEGMPNALMEAMTLGLCCVSTDCPCGGPNEIIDNNKTGILVPVNDKVTLSEKILQVIIDDNKRAVIGFNAKKYARENFYPEKIFKDWENYILSK